MRGDQFKAVVTDETELAALVKQGDRDAFATLYRLWLPKVLGFIRLYISDTDEQREIAQAVFIRLWNHRVMLRPEDGISGLLFIITRNLVFNDSHASAREESLKEALSLECSEVVHDTISQYEANDLENYIYGLVAKLPPRQREAFLLSRRHGKSYREIAEAMDISEEGVKRNIHLALKFIKKNLP